MFQKRSGSNSITGKSSHPTPNIHAVWHREVKEVKLHTFLTSALFGDVSFMFQSPLQPEKELLYPVTS
jgi:hypothetical protein